MPATLHKLLVIQDNTLKGMAAQKRFIVEFPFLQSLNRINDGGKKRCGSCRTSNNRTSEVFAAAKRVLASMPSAKKQRLKDMLGTKKIRVTYRQPGGKTVELTF
jgi:hypothetical protein